MKIRRQVEIVIETRQIEILGRSAGQMGASRCDRCAGELRGTEMTEVINDIAGGVEVSPASKPILGARAWSTRFFKLFRSRHGRQEK